MAEPDAEPVDIAQLTSEQQEALQTYTSVTDQDVAAAVPLLQRSEWNVQIAITKFFDGESADPLEAARREAADAVPAPQGRTSGVLLDDFGPSSVRYRGGSALRPGLNASGGGSGAGGRGGRAGGWRPPLVLAILFSPFTLLYRLLASTFELALDLWRGPPAPRARAPRTRPRVEDSATQQQQQQQREQQARQNLRQEQESAYEKSLRQDREKARVRREAEAAAAREQQVARDREQWRQWKAATLGPEPAQTKDVARLSLRLPDGERIIRRFALGAAVEEIYDFVETHGVELGEKPVTEPPDGYAHKYAFRLVQAMPRAVYESGSGTVASIGRNANLIVEPIEEGEEDNDDEEKEGNDEKKSS